MREWIEPGRNGLLYPPDRAGALTAALLQAAENADLRQSAARANRGMIEQRASRVAFLPRIAEFYAQVLRKS
jgi:glycosyltransferase involved in cell wall biosynthesis